MTREDIKTINDIVHKTIYGFFDICGDEETPMTDKDKLLLEVNKAVCNNIKDLEQEPCEDAISRQAVIDGLVSIAKAKAKSDAQKSLMGRIMFFTERLPSVNPQELSDISNDGTLTVNVEDGRKISRVLVCGANHWGGLYYPDEQEPKTGHWIFNGGIEPIGWYCSNCGLWSAAVYKPNYKYCPNCGAKMEEQA